MAAPDTPSTAAGRSDVSLPADIRRRLGAFYTPETVVNDMVALLTDGNKQGRILEPSGGDGAFVQGLLSAGVSVGSIDVWDINDGVREPLEELGVRVSIGDTLAYSGPRGQYTAVIGNPPYLNKQSEYIKANRSWLRKRYARIGANDTYAMFTYLAGELLAPDGQLVFLVSDTFMTLGIHEKFRDWLLTEMRLDSITLLPADTFDASVHTAVIAATKASVPANHQIRMVDSRVAGQSTVVLVDHASALLRPGKVFSFGGDTERLLKLAAATPKLVDVLYGGLGMHTGDNTKYLAVVRDSGLTARPGQRTVDRGSVDGVKWQAYHKRGGDQRWYGPAEHAVRWSASAQKKYGIPASATEGRSAKGKVRPGLVLSGISARLAARRMTPGAMWESNKAFCFFPRNPRKHPVDFIIAVLNSSLYSRIAQALNHTVSLQVRDVKRLPLLPFDDSEVAELAKLGAAAVNWTSAGGKGTAPQQERIDAIVEKVAMRYLSTRS